MVAEQRRLFKLEVVGRADHFLLDLLDGLAHIEVHAGRSTQATLLGRDDDTYESLYLSPALAKAIALGKKKPHTSLATSKLTIRFPLKSEVKEVVRLRRRSSN